VTQTMLFHPFAQQERWLQDLQDAQNQSSYTIYRESW